MKAGWEVKTLGSLLEVKNGYAFDSKKFTPDAGTPLIRIRNIKEGKGTAINYNGEYKEEFICKQGDFVIGMDGEFGCYEWKGDPSLLNQRVCRLENFDSRLTSRFLFYGINKYLKEIEEVTGYTTVKHLSSKTIKTIEFPLPPLAEQKRIVSILDGAFEGLDRARENAEANLKNAQELFEAHLKSIFLNDSLSWETDVSAGSAAQKELSSVGATSNLVSKRNTKTGGRAVAEKHILGNYSLSVNVPDISTRKGWKWSLLTDLARLESGHTPSRRKPEYWGGDIRWIGIKDARDRHGVEIVDTLENTNDLGINNSSARVLPKGTVCLSRTASVGYVTIMGRDMATSQDFVNWVCGPELAPEFLKIILLAQGAEFRKFSSGAVHQTIYFPEAKGFAICHPDIDTQKEIVKQADSVLAEAKMIIAKCQTKLQDISDLRQSLLQKAFAGELT